MNAANTNYIQATIELFGFIITFLVIMIFWIITGVKKKSEKHLMHAFFFTGLSLLLDAGWYIFDGNTSSAGYVMNWICNFAIFLCNPMMALFMSHYIRNLLDEKERTPNKILYIGIHICVLICILIPISNLIYPWMYYIDAQNVYVRQFGWYVYTVINSLAIMLLFVMVVLEKEYLPKRQKIALYVLFCAPFLGIALQALTLGISFIQIGIAIAIIAVVTCYLLDWIKDEKRESDLSMDKKRLWLIECVFSIMILIVSASIVSCVISVTKVSNENSEQNSKALAYMVSETVDAAINEPINVSRTMAQSEAVREALLLDSLEGTTEEAKMLSLMKRIEEEYQYQMVFIASEKTKAYYTFDGLSRYMQVDTDPNDAWYNEFKARNIKYELNIDKDKDNEMALAVFVNMEIRDEVNTLLGVCGVAMSIESLVKIIEEYENTYDLDVTLVNPDGFIQVSTNRDKIEQPFTLNVELKDKSTIITYSKNGSTSILSKYMNGLDWYLVVVDHNPNKINVFTVILPSMIIYFIGLVLMIAISLIFGINDRRRSILLRNSKRLSETDGLTGLKNRYSLERYSEAKQKQENKEKISIIAIDINGLKLANDTLGHDAGDELIKAVAEILFEIFNGYGDIYRTGGDEFIVISAVDFYSLEGLINILKSRVKSWKGKKNSHLSISLGFASNEKYPAMNLSELLKQADILMYQDKDLYYANKTNERRRRY